MRGQRIAKHGKSQFLLAVNQFTWAAGQIDKRPAMAWPQKKSLKIEGLEPSERHLLVVLDSGDKAIESVCFRFSEYECTDLCMSYDGYQGVQLHEDTRRTPWCKCE
jgi:hypothetical protein